MKLGIVSFGRMAILGGSIGVAVVGCGESEPFDSAESVQSNLYGGGALTTLWNGGTLGTGATIPVCFTTAPVRFPDGSFQCTAQTNRDLDCLGRPMQTDAARSAVRKNIENNWQKYANLEFFDWGDCPLTQGGSGQPAFYVAVGNLTGSIVVMPAVPRDPNDPTSINDWSAVGKQTSMATIMSLNFQTNPGTGRPVVESFPFNTIHEFGHALGFTHEWVRTDYVIGSCTRDVGEDANNSGNQLTIFPDYDSIMDKCGDAPTPIGLSPGDVIGIQRAYGRKMTGSLVGDRGNCADISNGDTAVGTPLIAFPCRNQWNQIFTRSSSTEQLKATTPAGSGRCMRNETGTVRTASCSSTDADQKFRMTRVQWRAMGKMCLEAVGTTIQSKVCDAASDMQRWSVMDGDSATSQRFDQIKSVGANKCVTVTSSGLGQQLTLATCSSTDTRQRFAFPGQGVVLYQPAGLCLNVSTGSTTPGQPLILWDGCTSSPRPYNAQFTFAGEVRTPSGQCLDILGGNSNQFDPIGAFTCSGNGLQSNQQWEYYP